MVATGTDSIQIVRDCLEGRRSMDDTVVSAMDMLSLRVQRLQRAGGLYAGVRFSAEMEEMMALTRQCEAGVI
jgi:hypothetical protein